MAAVIVAFVALAGGLGALARWRLDALIQSRHNLRFPLGIVLINLTGALVLGVVTGAAAGGVLPDPWPTLVGTGFLGGYTTFSAASVDTVRLLQSRRFDVAALHAFGTAAAATAAAAAGLVLGLTIAG